MDILLQDIRYAARKLLRTPAFTIIAVATLALAIGATTAVFSIVNGVLLKPLPFRDPDALVRIGSIEQRRASSCTCPCPTSSTTATRRRSFVGMAQIQERNSANLSIAGSEPQRLNAASVGAQVLRPPRRPDAARPRLRRRRRRERRAARRRPLGQTVAQRASAPTNPSSGARSR